MTDYKTMTLEELQLAHSQLCAIAHDNGVELTDTLTFDFDDQGAGANICRQIHNLLDDAGVSVRAHGEAEQGLAEGAEQVQSAPEPARKKKAKTKQVATDVGAAKKQETKVTKTAKKTTAKSAKKTAKKTVAKKAKKVVAKKATAKKAAKANGKKAKKKNGTGKIAQAIAMMQRAKGATRTEILKALDWKAISIQQITTNAGVKLKYDKTKRPFVYHVAA
jgi:hypothetical protein